MKGHWRLAARAGKGGCDMLKEQKDLIQKFVLCVDVAVVGASFLIALLLRDYLDLSFEPEMPSFTEYLPTLLLVISLWVIMLWSFGVYESMRGKRFTRLFWSLLEASLAAMLAF